MTAEHEDLGLTPEARRQRYLANKPDISDLDEAVEVVELNGKLDLVALFGPGDRIIVERTVQISPFESIWLDTRKLLVKEIDDDTGHCKCWDEESHQTCIVGFKSPLQVFKLGKGVPGKRKRKQKQRRSKK